MSEQQEVFTVEEAARYLKTSPTNVYAMLRTGRLKGVKIGPSGKSWRIHRKSLEQFLQGQSEIQVTLPET